MRSAAKIIGLLALLVGTCRCPSAYGHRPATLPIPRDSNIFIDPMNGFGDELKRAFLKEGVSLDIVSNKSMADFEITGNMQGHGQTQESRSVSLRILDLKTREIVWGYGVTGITDSPSTAASCAKQLKQEMQRRR
jgi:hypothetical protein